MPAAVTDADIFTSYVWANMTFDLPDGIVDSITTDFVSSERPFEFFDFQVCVKYCLFTIIARIKMFLYDLLC